jgi:dienelactone hydrolase
LGSRVVGYASAKNPNANAAFAAQEALSGVAALLCLAVILGIDARLAEQRRKVLGVADAGSDRHEAFGRWAATAVIATVVGAAVGAGVVIARGGAQLSVPGLVAGLIAATLIVVAGRWPIARGVGGLIGPAAIAIVALGAMGGFVRVHLQRAIAAEQEASKAFDVCVDHSDAVDDAALVQLDADVAALEAIADRVGHDDANVYRCEARAIRELVHANAEILDAHDALASDSAHSDASRIALHERIRDASNRAVARLDDRYVACARSFGVPMSAIPKLPPEVVRQDASMRDLHAKGAAFASAQIEVLRRPADPSRARDAEIVTGRDLGRARRKMNPVREVAVDALPVARLETTVEPVRIARPAAPLDAPHGMRRIEFRGPGGKMPAYVTMRPKPELAKRPVLVVPSNQSVTSLEVAGQLARAGYWVMMPTVRGWPGTAFEEDDNFHEIDDLSAARDAFSVMVGERRDRMLIVGVNAGATRAMLLAASTNRFEAVLAVEPELDPEDPLRSPLHFARAYDRPIYLVSGFLDVLVDADEIDEIAPGHVHPLRGRRVESATELAAEVLALVTGHAGADGAFALSQEDVTH